MPNNTTSSSRTNVDGKISWNNYDGTKGSHDVNVTQMNVKDSKTGDHMFYNPKQGRQGVALGGAERKGKVKSS